MRRIFSTRPSPAMVVAIVALIFALAGSGYAATTINGKNIKNRSISGKKLKNRTITARKVKKNTLTGTEIRESRLGNVFTFGRSAQDTGGPPAVCDPGGATFLNCVSVTLALPRAGRVHLTGTGDAYSYSAAVAAQGDCRLTVDGAPLAGSLTQLGQQNIPGAGLAGGANRNRGNGFATTAVTDPLPAGAHTFTLACNENAGDFEAENTQINALMISRS